MLLYENLVPPIYKSKLSYTTNLLVSTGPDKSEPLKILIINRVGYLYSDLSFSADPTPSDDQNFRQGGDWEKGVLALDFKKNPYLYLQNASYHTKAYGRRTTSTEVRIYKDEITMYRNLITFSPNKNIEILINGIEKKVWIDPDRLETLKKRILHIKSEKFEISDEIYKKDLAQRFKLQISKEKDFPKRVLYNTFIEELVLLYFLKNVTGS